jgi:hypothetical protein
MDEIDKISICVMLGIFFYLLFVISQTVFYTDNDFTIVQNCSIMKEVYNPIFIGKIWIPHYEKICGQDLIYKNGTKIINFKMEL